MFLTGLPRDRPPWPGGGTGQPVGRQARASGWFRLTRPAAFWLTAVMMVLFMGAAAAPTPLYRVYQAQWGFSTATLTAVFAVYVLFLLVTLLVFGSLSDHVGRRPVVVAALAVDAAACGLFLLAHGVGLLFAARALQGVAVGATASTLGAAPTAFGALPSVPWRPALHEQHGEPRVTSSVMTSFFWFSYL